MENSTAASQQNDLLNEYNQEVTFEDATQGQRFANYIIDLIVFYLFSLFIGVIIGIVFIATNPDSDTFNGSDDLIDPITDRIISMLLYGLLMSVIEGLFKGRTLGKLITRTKAIKVDGSEFTWADAFKRGFSRIVPFEPFSALGGNPWHDKWTGTRVVKLRN